MAEQEHGINPFTISIPDEKLSILKEKLTNATFPDELDEAGWDYGVPLGEIKRLTEYWRDGFDWRAQEEKLNQFPQFQASIAANGFDPLDIHFLHQRSEVKGAIPLLFVHGWPGSFLEATKILDLLASSGGHPSFHVVAPSLPNFGFSEGPKRKGFGQKQYAEICHKLMLSLGYDEYVTQGGDWGYMVTRAIGYLYPKHCKASHVNMLPIGPPSFTKHPLLFLQAVLLPMTPSEKGRIARLIEYTKSGNGYMVEQSSKPQTIGYALIDSPVALLAWVYEKLYEWTDSYPWTDDEILTWISIYWFSRAGPSASVRIYYEFAHVFELPASVRDGWIPDVKYGIAYFEKEIISVPRVWTKVLGNIVHEGECNRGGHFAAWEQPEFMTQDLRKMFGKGGGAYGVIKGKSGY